MAESTPPTQKQSSNKIIFIILGIALIIFLCMCCCIFSFFIVSLESYNNPKILQEDLTPTRDYTLEEDVPDSVRTVRAGIGDTVDMDKYQFKVIRSEVGEGFDNAEYPVLDDFESLSLEVEIINTGSTEIAYNSYSFNFAIIDDNGYSHYPILSGGKEPKLDFGTITIGESITGWITFEVPKNRNSLDLEFNNYYGNEKIIVKID